MTDVIRAGLVDFSLTLDDATQVRLLRVSNADELFELTDVNREHLAPWMSWVDLVRDAGDTLGYLRTCEQDMLAQRAFRAGIFHEHRLAGAIDLHDIDWVNRNAKIGYWLDKAHTGKGIMTRAVRALVGYAFEALDLHRIEIRAATENHASRRIPERLGFEMEAVLADGQFVSGRFHDLALYATTQDEWEDGEGA